MYFDYNSEEISNASRMVRRPRPPIEEAGPIWEPKFWL